MRQEELVLWHLQEHGPLTGRAALDLYRVHDLPKRVSVLRAEGHHIERDLRRDDTGSRHATYKLA